MKGCPLSSSDSWSVRPDCTVLHRLAALPWTCAAQCREQQRAEDGGHPAGRWYPLLRPSRARIVTTGAPLAPLSLLYQRREGAAAQPLLEVLLLRRQAAVSSCRAWGFLASLCRRRSTSFCWLPFPSPPVVLSSYHTYPCFLPFLTVLLFSLSSSPLSPLLCSLVCIITILSPTKPPTTTHPSPPKIARRRAALHPRYGALATLTFHHDRTWLSWIDKSAQTQTLPAVPLTELESGQQ